MARKYDVPADLSIVQLAEMLKDKVLFDGRNIWNMQYVYEVGLTYYSIGRRTYVPLS